MSALPKTAAELARGWMGVRRAEILVGDVRALLPTIPDEARS